MVLMLAATVPFQYNPPISHTLGVHYTYTTAVLPASPQHEPIQTRATGAVEQGEGKGAVVLAGFLWHSSILHAKYTNTT